MMSGRGLKMLEAALKKNQDSSVNSSNKENNITASDVFKHLNGVPVEKNPFEMTEKNLSRTSSNELQSSAIMTDGFLSDLVNAKPERVTRFSDLTTTEPHVSSSSERRVESTGILIDDLQGAFTEDVPISTNETFNSVSYELRSTEQCELTFSSIPNAVSTALDVIANAGSHSPTCAFDNSCFNEGIFSSFDESNIASNDIGSNEQITVNVSSKDDTPFIDIPLVEEGHSVCGHENSTQAKRKRMPENWKCNVNKKRRLQGQSYFGKQYQKDSENQKTVYVERSAVKLGPRCNGKNCDNENNGNRLSCHRLSEEKRQELFNYFWNETDWDQRKTYVCSLIDVVAKKQGNEDTRRTCSLHYYLKIGSAEDDRIRVCAKMFQNTLQIPHRTILNWLSKSSHGLSRSSSNTPKQSRSSGASSSNKERIDLAKDFIDSLDKVPSHYCRKTTNKQYLWPYDFTSAQNVHQKYISWLKEKMHHPEESTINPVSLTTFKALLKEKNIDIFQPRKDQCDTCNSHKQGNISDEDYSRHLQLKDSARNCKTQDKDNAKLSDGSSAVITVDVQAVQTIPKLNASCLYFRTKLNLHNYTIYNNVNQDVHCYVWTESNGGLSANNFTSCLIDYLTQIKQENLKTITIWSDGCGSQNKNCTLISSVSTWAKDNNVTVYFKYLEKGHTQMEVDSVHSKIEKYQKNLDLHVPADYCKVVERARKNPFPFKCHYLSYDFFKQYDATQTRSSIRPGFGRGDPCVTDVKEYKCDHIGDIYYKLSHDEQSPFLLLPHRRRETSVRPGNLYSAMLPISRRKYNDLQEMKRVIHPDHHAFYDNLPSNSL